VDHAVAGPMSCPPRSASMPAYTGLESSRGQVQETKVNSYEEVRESPELRDE